MEAPRVIRGFAFGVCAYLLGAACLEARVVGLRIEGRTTLLGGKSFGLALVRK